MENNSLCVIAVGGFGLRLAHYFQRLHQGRLELIQSDGIGEFKEVAADIVALAASRPVPALCSWLDEWSYRNNRPFIPLTVESLVLRLGPVVIPGAGSCWHCYASRCDQHSSHFNSSVALTKYYAANSKGPEGYLEPFAFLGAGRLEEVTCGVTTGEVSGGYIWQQHMMTCDVITSSANGIDDCPRCGMHRTQDCRTHLQLKEDLTFLWQR